MMVTVKELCGKYFAQVRESYSAGNRILFESPEYLTEAMALADAKCWLAFHGEGETVKKEPRTIKWATAVCSRCEGEKRNPAWGKVAGGWCFRCDGAGWNYTREGRAALEAYETMRDERLGARYGDLAVGDSYYNADGKCLRKSEGAWIHPDDRVRRHDGPATRQMWREIAAQYPNGATLVY